MEKALCSTLSRPRVGNLVRARELVHDEDELMRMVAVQHVDVDAGRGYAAREQTKLTGHVLLQSQHDDFPFREDSYACRLQCLSGGGSVREEEVSDSLATHDPDPTAFNAHPSAAQGLSHVSKRTGSVFQGDRQIPHDRDPQVATCLPGASFQRVRTALPS